jgi:hypothetical protein
MRLGFRKASNGSSRGKRWNPKMKSSPASAASSDGTDVPWPPTPPWPADDTSGRGGIGPRGRGHRGVAERSGRGGAFAVRARTTGVGPTTVGEERSYQALLTTPRIHSRRTAACRCFLAGTGRGRAGGVRSRALFAGAGAVAGVCEIGSSASVLWGARVAAVELAPATAFWANVTAWVTMSSAATEPASDGCWAAPSAESTIPWTCVERSPGPKPPAACAEPGCRFVRSTSPRTRTQMRASTLQLERRSAWRRWFPR